MVKKCFLESSLNPFWSTAETFKLILPLDTREKSSAQPCPIPHIRNPQSNEIEPQPPFLQARKRSSPLLVPRAFLPFLQQKIQMSSFILGKSSHRESVWCDCDAAFIHDYRELPAACRTMRAHRTELSGHPTLDQASL